jgi:hypothetical protein
MTWSRRSVPILTRCAKDMVTLSLLYASTQAIVHDWIRSSDTRLDLQGRGRLRRVKNGFGFIDQKRDQAFDGFRLRRPIDLGTLYLMKSRSICGFASSVRPCNFSLARATENPVIHKASQTAA